MIWGRIENRADRVLILGAGPSLASAPREAITKASGAGVHIIAVNAALLVAPFANDWFSLDFDERTRGFAREAGPDTRVIAAVPDDFGRMDARIPHHRCQAPPGVVYLHRLEGNGPLRAKSGLCNDPGAIHTGNSAWGALGLAWHMKPARVAFLGLDGTQKPGWPGTHLPRGLGHLGPLFASAGPQLKHAGVEVRVGNPLSRITCFKRVRPIDALEWIRG